VQANVNLRIHGMTCGGCSARVEQALRSVAGVSHAAVELLTESAQVTTNGVAPAPQSLVQAVRNVGYDAEVIVSGPSIADSDIREKLRRHRQALFQAIGLVLPILAIDHFRHDLWSHRPESQIAARLLEIVLLIMLGVSPAGGPGVDSSPVDQPCQRLPGTLAPHRQHGPAHHDGRRCRFHQQPLWRIHRA
jgi:cation transport ATPase